MYSWRGTWLSTRTTLLHYYITTDHVENYVMMNFIACIPQLILLWGDEVVGTCSTHGEEKECTGFLLQGPKGGDHWGRPKHRWEDNIKMHLRGIGIDGAS
jgi:hypothetical protein